MPTNCTAQITVTSVQELEIDGAMQFQLGVSLMLNNFTGTGVITGFPNLFSTNEIINFAETGGD